MMPLWSSPDKVIAFTFLHHRGSGSCPGNPDSEENPLLMARDLNGSGVGFAVRKHKRKAALGAGGGFCPLAVAA